MTTHLFKTAALSFMVCGVLLTTKMTPAGEKGDTGHANATNFQFKKKGVLIPHPTRMPKPGPYYTTLVPMKEVRDFPFDYALYFSTDHHRGEGGIWLYVCKGIPTDPANWKSYDQALADGDFGYLKNKPKANPIFLDRTQGHQTETPHANVIDGKVFMTYHNSGAGHRQSTLLATSKDGVTFKRLNGKKDSIILDYDPQKEPGNGHTGYLRWRPNPFPAVDYKYVGYSLHGGGDDFHGAMWGSNDAVHWDKIQIFDGLEGHAIAEKDRIVRRRSIDPNSITRLGNGEFVAICASGNRTSGGRPRTVELYEIFLGEDGVSLTRECRRILQNGPRGSYDEEEFNSATSVLLGDTWHLIYVGTSEKARRNTIMCATGKLDLSAPASKKLEPSDQKRDFHRTENGR